MTSRSLALIVCSLLATALGLFALDDASATVLRVAGAAVIGLGLIGVARGAIMPAGAEPPTARRRRARR